MGFSFLIFSVVCDLTMSDCKNGTVMLAFMFTITSKPVSQAFNIFKYTAILQYVKFSIYNRIPVLSSITCLYISLMYITFCWRLKSQVSFYVKQTKRQRKKAR